MDCFLDNLYSGFESALIVYILFSLYHWLVKKEKFVSAFLDLKLIGITICIVLFAVTIITIFLC